jgi:hypothetical protein
MKNIQEPGQCQHEQCTCPISESGGSYCSEACEKAAGGEIGNECPCGHADCAG